jgi:signal transduction histidine kinase/CheY-like chemotaxis protein
LRRIRTGGAPVRTSRGYNRGLVTDSATFPASRRPRRRRRSACTAGALLFLLLLPLHARAEDAQLRLFTSDDGLPESWVWQIARGSTGRVWTTHGVPGVASFDGYRIRTTPTSDTLRAISEGPDGILWALLIDPARNTCVGVQTLDLSGWTRYPVAALEGYPAAAVRLLAWAPGRVLILLPTRVIEFSAAPKSTRLMTDSEAWHAGTFRALQPSSGGGALLSAHRALLRLGRPAAVGVSAPTEIPLPPWLQDIVWASDFGGMLLVVGHRQGDPSGILARHEDAGWTVVATGTPEQPLVAGWAGVDRSIWIVRSNATGFILSVIEHGRPEVRLARQRALAGTLNAIVPAPDGSFWLGTSVGLVRYQPRVWRRPPELADYDVPTGGLIEAMNGEIFAVQGSTLLRRGAAGWQAYPLPPGFQARPSHTQTIGVLADGRVVIGRNGTGAQLIFDPASGRFADLVHPEGRSIQILGSRIPSGVWAITRRPGTAPRVESYDVQGFRVRAQVPSGLDGDDNPRHILDTRSGDLFITPTAKGIARVSGSTVTWVSAGDLAEARPFAGAELPDGTIWFGGREGLLALNGGRLTRVRAGLQTVRSIINAHDGSVWVASNSGVHRFADGDWLTITDADGLPEGAVFDLLEDDTGRMWVATSSGIGQRHANADVDAPETVLSESENVLESPPSGDVRMVFSARDRWASTPAGRLLYSYRLDDAPWSPFNAATGASLAGVAAGRHRFSVRAMDRNWNIDATPATMWFTVLLPWYREPGVMALGIAAALALGVAVVLFLTHHRRLEREVRERTDALRAEFAERQRIESERAGLEQQLRQSQKMEAIGRLAGGISHDFNNLLTVICSYADLILDATGDADPRHDYAREIARAGGRAASLTGQLLSFSRQQPVQREVIDLNATLADLHRMLARLLGERVDLRFAPGAGAGCILADRGQVEQVVVNLAVNARDAMPNGGRLTIETANVDLDDSYVQQRVDASAGPFVRLTLIDTGIGMDEDTKARLFEPFFTTKPSGQGSGLGLAIVYGIVRQNGGHVVVTSNVGQGSRFDVYLPRTDALAAPSLRTPAMIRKALTGTLLLVEDEDAVRQLARTALERDGYRVFQAASGEEALALIERERVRPDLVLTDVVMPGLDGRQLVSRLREQLPGVPVLLMSGYAGPGGPVSGETDPNLAFLQKPFTPSALSDAVQQLLAAE